jgi:hypothetical protein
MMPNYSPRVNQELMPARNRLAGSLDGESQARSPLTFPTSLHFLTCPTATIHSSSGFFPSPADNGAMAHGPKPKIEKAHGTKTVPWLPLPKPESLAWLRYQKSCAHDVPYVVGRVNHALSSRRRLKAGLCTCCSRS